MSSPVAVVGQHVGSLRRRAWAAVPKVRGTECQVCRYEVPALGLPPDHEMAWFERFEGRPCPHCVGMAVGVAVGAVLIGALRRSAR